MWGQLSKSVVNIFVVLLSAIYTHKARNVGPGGCASLLTLPDSEGVLNYGNLKPSILLKMSLAH